MSFRAIIFDFNGTISDDEPVLDRLFRELADELGHPMTSADYYRELAGHSDPAIVARIIERCGAADTPAERARLLREKVDRYKAIVAAHPTVGDDVTAFVRAAAARMPVAIASGAVREEVEHVLALAGLRSLFTAVVCAEDVPAGKPDPAGYRLALEELNATLGGPPIAPAEVLVYEDADAGVQAAKAAGMVCVALRNAAYTGAFVPADAVIDHLGPAELARLGP